MRVNRGQSAQIVSIPAPVGGLNTVDGIANMPPLDAVKMENWFPEVSSVKTRNGSTLHSNALDAINFAAVDTLAVYNGNTSNKLFGAASNVIYDITTSGVNNIAVAGYASVFQWVQMGTIGGRFLLTFNGVNQPRYYDGTVWTAVFTGAGPTDILGVDTTKLINCNVYKNRLFMVEVSTANVWYLPINSIYGTANKLDLSSLLRKGSTIVAMCTWAVDNAGGLQDYAVFISNVGEVLVYEGSDPAVATDFKLSASFNIGSPVGYRCFEKLGSDIIILCTDGAFPLSKALLTDRSQQQLATTNKINGLLEKDISDWSILSTSNPQRWSILLYSSGSKLIINSDYPTNKQFVMNTTTGAWCLFTGWNATCFVVFNDRLYFGAKNSKVYRGDAGLDDDGTPITVDCQQAFQNFGSSIIKQFTSVRPVLKIEQTPSAPNMKINKNFEQPTATTTTLTVDGSSSRVSASWQSSNASGFSAAPRFAFKIDGIPPAEWQATDIMFKAGGLL